MSMEMVWVRMPRRVSSWSSFRADVVFPDPDGALPQVIGNLIRRRADFLLKGSVRFRQKRLRSASCHPVDLAELI